MNQSLVMDAYLPNRTEGQLNYTYNQPNRKENQPNPTDNPPDYTDNPPDHRDNQPIRTEDQPNCTETRPNLSENPANSRDNQPNHSENQPMDIDDNGIAGLLHACKLRPDMGEKEGIMPAEEGKAAGKKATKEGEAEVGGLEEAVGEVTDGEEGCSLTTGVGERKWAETRLSQAHTSSVGGRKKARRRLKDKKSKDNSIPSEAKSDVTDNVTDVNDHVTDVTDNVSYDGADYVTDSQAVASPKNDEQEGNGGVGLAHHLQGATALGRGVSFDSSSVLKEVSEWLAGSEAEHRKMKLWLSKIVKVLLEHMNQYGMCVVDNFLGFERGNGVLEEVKVLHNKQVFKDGQVMSGGGLHEPSVRSDKIVWTDGQVPFNTPALRHLVKLMDSIVLTANKVPNNREFGKYRLSGRTNIMVACYPGEGTHYIRHVDNPNHDGRVVTAIYYLNKDWNTETDGGSLNIYSQINGGTVAKVEPLFDRVIFFWSDYRNPHEVLPAYRPRYAVTVWYLDQREKEVYERKRRDNLVN